MRRVEGIHRQEAARLLGVDVDAQPSEVRRAFRLWATVAHPDLGGSQEQFARLCAARDVLLAPPPRSAPENDNSTAESRGLPARTPWRDVLRRPSPSSVIVLGALALISMASVAIALVVPVPWGLAPAALAATATCVAASRTLLRDPDHGHVIVTRSIAWLVMTAVQCTVAVLAGIPAFESLPLLAVPFVACISLVNPGAGLWRARQSPSH